MPTKQKYKTKSKTKSRGLGNPAAVVAVASTPAGQKAVSGGIKVGKIILISGVVLVGASVGYQLYKNRFVKLLQNRNFPKPKISTAQAQSRAEAIYKAMYGMGSGFNTVYEQLSGGLSYNDFVLIYNAFGKRKPATQNINPFRNPFDRGWTLFEWFESEFSDSQKKELRFLTSNFF